MYCLKPDILRLPCAPDKRRRVNSLRASELAASKTLKNGTPPLRVLTQALCILLDVMPDKGPAANEADKKVTCPPALGTML